MNESTDFSCSDILDMLAPLQIVANHSYMMGYYDCFKTALTELPKRKQALTELPTSNPDLWFEFCTGRIVTLVLPCTELLHVIQGHR